MQGVLFHESLFPSVISKGKTQTRRFIKPQPTLNCNLEIMMLDDSFENYHYGVVEKYIDLQPDRYRIHQLLKPKYRIGEVLFLKEPWLETEFVTVYKYGYPNSLPRHWLDDVAFPIPNVNNLKFNNKLFMGKKNARYFIQITDVRIEKLQDISNEDCVKEGIEYSPEAVPIGYPFGAEFPYNNGFHNYTTAKEAYAALIDKINGKGTWESNPWVWIYSFILIR